MRRKDTERVQPISLDGIQMKNRIEPAISYNHNKYKNIQLLFANKQNPDFKLPFSDFKIGIAQELMEREQLIENINRLLTYRYQEAIYKEQLQKYNEYLKQKEELEAERLLLAEEMAEQRYHVVEEPVEEEPLIEEEEIFEEEVIEQIEAIEPEPVVEPTPVPVVEPEPIISTTLPVEEIKEEKPSVSVVESTVEKITERRKSTTITLSADTDKVIAKIKAEAEAKNKGKKVRGRRDINIMIERQNARKKKKMLDMQSLENQTIIDIYLSAIEKMNENEN